MKEFDITEPVMNRIVRYEKRRIGRWFALFSGILFVCTSILVILLRWFVSDIVQFRTWDMASLLGEDREIILEFWRDAGAVILEELPWPSVYLMLGIIGAALVLMAVTRHRRKVMERKLAGFAKRTKNGNNTNSGRPQ